MYTYMRTKYVLMFDTQERAPVPDTWYHLPIYPSTDSVYDGDNKILLQLQTPDTVRSHPLWQGYVLPTATVSCLYKKNMHLNMQRVFKRILL